MHYTEKQFVQIQPGNKYFLKTEGHEYAYETSMGYPAKQYLLAEGSSAEMDSYQETI